MSMRMRRVIALWAIAAGPSLLVAREMIVKDTFRRTLYVAGPAHNSGALMPATSWAGDRTTPRA